jgi:O-antigen/teichoic acid export membrane protein
MSPLGSPRPTSFRNRATAAQRRDLPDRTGPTRVAYSSSKTSGGLQRRLAHAVGAMSGASVLGAAIAFLSTPLLVHWFPPAQFGEVAYALAAASILSSLVSLRLELVIYKVPAADRRETAWLATLVTIAIATLLLVAALPFASLLGGAAHSGTSNLLVIYAMLVSICIANIGVAFLTAEGRYVAAGIPKVISPLVLLAAAAVIHLAPDTGGLQLVIANVLGLIAAAGLYLGCFAGRFDAVALRGARALVRRNKRYIMFAAPQNSVAIAGFLNLGMIIIGTCYGKHAAGEVFMAFRLVGFPSTVLGVAASNFIAAESGGRAIEKLSSYALAMAGAGVAIYLPLLLAGLALPAEWLPVEWRGAVDMLPPMTLLCFAHFVIGSFGQILLVRDRAGQMLAWDSARLLVTCSVVLACWLLGGGYILAMWLFVCAQLPLYLVLALLVRRAAAAPSATAG